MDHKFFSHFIIKWLTIFEITTFITANSFNSKLTDLNKFLTFQPTENNEEHSSKIIFKRSAPPQSSIPPSPPEIIKFELSDAKEPDEATKEFFRKIRQQLNLEEQSHTGEHHHNNNMTNIQMMMIINDTISSIDDNEDQSSHESQKIKVYVPHRPGKHRGRKSINLLPQEVQKAINIFLKNEYELKQQQKQQQYTPTQDTVASGTVATPNHVFNYGDKLTISNVDNGSLRKFKSIYTKGAVGSNGIHNIGSTTTTLPLIESSPTESYYPAEPKFHLTNYIPVAAVKLKRLQLSQIQSPVVDTKQYQPVVEFHPVEMVKVIPQINYAIQEVPSPVLVAPQPISHKQLTGPTTAIYNDDTNGNNNNNNNNNNKYPSLQYNIQPVVTSSSSLLKDDEDELPPLPQQQQQQQQHQQQQNHQISYSDSLGYHNVGVEQQQQTENTIQNHEIVKPSDDSKYEALSSLIGKNPVDQLKGLTYLLSNEQQQNLLKYQNFKYPEDNTAPIQFPKKNDNLNHQHLYHQGIIVNNDDDDVDNDDGNNNDDNDNETDNKYKYNEVNGITPSYYKYPSSTVSQKEYTPVTETPFESHTQSHTSYSSYPYHNSNPLPQQHHHHFVHDDVQQEVSYQYPVHHATIEKAKIVHITPPTITSSPYHQKIGAVGLSPNYKGIQHDENGLQYASKYAFGYRVRDFHTGNDFAHRQNRDIDGVTRGEYHILLPDGRVQNVRYHADDSGFHADVQFETGH